MSRKCDLNLKKGVLSGNKVSHSNRKTKRKFLPNIQTFSLISDSLGTVRISASTSTVRTIEHNNGIDNYLLKTPYANLAKDVRVLKKKIEKKIQAKNILNETL